jgi:uncharacterized membrane protein YgcG
MKKHLFLLVCTIALLISACGPNNCPNNAYGQGQTVAVTSSDPSINLDLNALLDIVKTSRDANEIESRVNQPNGINYCDIDNDGQVDYIKVAEYQNGIKRGYNFYALTNNGDKQVAQVEFDNNTNTAFVQGNPSYYSYNNYYSTSFATDWLIWSYLYRPHVIYVSPYHYGYYRPGYYHYRTISRTSYYSRPAYSHYRSTQYKSIDNRRQTLNNRSLSNQKSFNRDFKVRDPNKKVNASGFKSKSSSSSWKSSSNSSWKSNSSSRSTWKSSSSRSSSSGRSSGFGGRRR